MRTLLVTVSLLLAFTTGCGGSSEEKDNANAGAQTTPTELASPLQKKSVFPKPADMPDVKSYGASSPECKVASEVMMRITEAGLKISLGSLTQADFTKAFAQVDQLPSELRPMANQLRALASGLVGKTAEQSAASLSPWGLSMAQLARATQKVCS